MPAQGRKNVHGKTGVRFKAAYTASKYNNMLRNVVTQLVISEKVVVTAGIAKDLVHVSDRLVTYAKKGDLNSRRLAAAVLRRFIVDEKAGTVALDKLFNEIGPRYKDRNGGYTRILKTMPRRGDGAPMVILELVD